MRYSGRMHSNYGWIICAVCTLLLFCTAGLGSTAFAIYQPYLLEYRKLSDFQASFLPTLRNLSGMLGMFLVILLLRKIEARRTAFLGIVMTGLGYLVFGLTNDFIGSLIGSAVIGLGYGIGGMITASIIMTRWFNRHRGLAMGICMSTTGLSTAVSTPVISYLVEKYSLRTAFITETAFIFLVALIVLLFVRSKPSDMKAEPVGGWNIENNQDDMKVAYAENHASGSMLFLMIAGFTFIGGVLTCAISFLGALYRNAGFLPGHIVVIISMYGLSLTAGKLIYGMVTDKIGNYKAAWIFSIFAAVGVFICSTAKSGNYPAAVAGSVILGCGSTIISVAVPMYAVRVAMREEYKSTLRAFEVGKTFGAVVLGAAVGKITDISQGSYVPSYLIMVVIVTIGVVLVQIPYKRIRCEDIEKVNNQIIHDV